MQCVFAQLTVKQSCAYIGDGSSVEIVDEFCYLPSAELSHYFYTRTIAGDTDAVHQDSQWLF